MEENVKRNGRKRKSEAKDVRLIVRITEEEKSQLDEMSAAQDKTLSDILRNGIRMQYNMHKYLP